MWVCRFAIESGGECVVIIAAGDEVCLVAVHDEDEFCGVFEHIKFAARNAIVV